MKMRNAECGMRNGNLLQGILFYLAILLCFVMLAEGTQAQGGKKARRAQSAPAVIGGAATGIVAPGPNLLKNGDFEKGTGWPEGWEKTKAPGADAKTAAGVRIEVAPGEAGHGKVLHMSMDQAAADAPGMMLLSEEIPVTQGKTYHLSAEVKSMGPAVVLFVKGFGHYVSKSGGGKESAIYEKKQESRLEKGKWGVMSFDFTPQYGNPATRKVYERRKIQMPTVDRIKVELYAYHPAGEVYFDNVRVTEGATAPAAYITEGSAGAKATPTAPGQQK